MRKILTIAFSLYVPVVCLAQQPLPRLGKDPVDKVVAAMTPEEKARLLVGMGILIPGIPPNIRKANAPNPSSAPEGGMSMPVMDSLDAATPQKVPGAAGRTHAIPRLGIPTIILSDGPAGVRIEPVRKGDSSKTYFATAFPVGTLLASSWDTALVKKVGEAFGEEIRDYAVDIILGPGMNIHRNPLGGRNFEYYSEDPLLSGRIAAAMVKGIQSKGVGTSVKHFAGNNQETNRGLINTMVSERALREIYLRNFEYAIKESSPWTVMSSYNKINGRYTSESPGLLLTVLREEWGFKGFVTSDWFGGKNVADQVNAGNDVLMPGTPDQSDSILEGISSGKISMKAIDRNVTDILNIILISPSFKHYAASEKPDLKAHAALTRTAAGESMVLLKNNSGLPLAPKKNIALFGNTSYELIAGGSGSGDVNKAYTISLNQGLKNSGYLLNATISDAYARYLKEEHEKQPRPVFFFMLPPRIEEMKYSRESIEKAAGESDVALFTLGRNAGEGSDRDLKKDFSINDSERDLIREISEAFHKKGKKFIVVLNIDGVIETASWRGYSDAILLAWQPGLEGGNSMADVLSGKINPSGKLPTSFPLQYDDVPSAKSFPGRELDPAAKSIPFMGKPAEVTYEEGIYVSYRYYESFHVKTAWPFGFGLSYTSFKYSNLTLSSNNFNENLTAMVTVTNTGKTAGREAVELYLSAPRVKINKPEEELKAFAKTRLLKPGESQTIRFTLDFSSLASFDTDQTRWIADAGKYEVKIGASAEDIRLTRSFNLNREIKGPVLHKVLEPAEEIKELQPITYSR